MRSLIALVAVASLAAGAASAQYGGAKEPASPPAAQSKPITPPAASTPTSPSTPSTAAAMSETQAKTRIEAQGYSNVSQLEKDARGVWTARAMKDGKSVQLSLDAQGKVTPRN